MDWISTFVSSTASTQSPESFRTWTGISIIAGALERRVWIESDKGILYPNLMVLLSGLPASGKSIMVNKAREFWSNVNGGIDGLHLGPDNPTPKSFLDQLERSQRNITNGAGLHIFHSVQVSCRELGNFLSKYDPTFINCLTDLYDNPPQYFAPRSTTKTVKIDKPNFNLIAGATPDFLNEVIPEHAWGQGFTSRLMFIYGERIENLERDPFKKSEKLNLEALRELLDQIFLLQGEVYWSEDAKDLFRNWIRNGKLPEPKHSKLIHYNSRREEIIWKLTTIAAVSRSRKLEVELEDFNTAQNWLLNAEVFMPDVFRSMNMKSDTQIIQDLWYFVWTKWASVRRDQREPIHESIIWEWFEDKAPSNRIPYILMQAVKSGILKNDIKPGHFVPKPWE